MPKITVNPKANTTEEKPIVLGRGGDGKLVEATLGELKSTLITGMSGSGKSTLMTHMIEQSIEQAQVFLIDMKRISYPQFKNVPNCHVITDINKVPKLFSKLSQELENRFVDCERKGINYCNAGRIVVYIDECAELLPYLDKNTYDQIRRILSLGRACNMTIIMATQQASRRILTGALLDLFCSKIGLRQNSIYASKIAIDRPGCEKLSDFSALYLNPQGFLTQFEVLPPNGEDEDANKAHDTIDWEDD